jgi:hypothetical protein
MDRNRNFLTQVAKFGITVGVGLVIGSASRPALAQNEVTPAGNGRFYVELKDASLYDAVQLILKAAGSAGTATQYTVDDSAKLTNIGSITFNNAQWDSIIRRLANENGFVIRLNTNGSKVIEPKAPLIPEGGEFGYPGGFPGGYPGGYPGSGSSGYPGQSGFGAQSGLPQNPFGGAPRRGRGNRPQVSTSAAPQTAPNLGRGGTATNNQDEGKEYRLVMVRHVYVGGIAQLFSNSDTISTEDFLIPESAMNGGMMGGGMMGGGFGGGGMGGIGGIGGGFGF